MKRFIKVLKTCLGCLRKTTKTKFIDINNTVESEESAVSQSQPPQSQAILKRNFLHESVYSGLEENWVGGIS